MYVQRYFHRKKYCTDICLQMCSSCTHKVGYFDELCFKKKDFCRKSVCQKKFDKKLYFVFQISILISCVRVNTAT
jgi:hypothetical protein